MLDSLLFGFLQKYGIIWVEGVANSQPLRGSEKGKSGDTHVFPRSVDE